jgi:hypothetical protein
MTEELRPLSYAMVVEYRPPKPSRHGSVEIPGGRDEVWDETVMNGLDPPDKPLEEDCRKFRSKFRTNLSSKSILRACRKELNDIKLVENSGSWCDTLSLLPSSIDTKHQIEMCSTSSSASLSKLVPQQTYASEIPETTMPRNNSAELLKEDYNFFGLKFDTDVECMVQEVKSKAPSSRTIDRTCGGEKPRKNLSCPNIKSHDSNRDPTATKIKCQDVPSVTVPPKRLLERKSRSCPRNLGHLLPTIGETEVLKSSSHHTSKSTCGGIPRGSFSGRSACWSGSSSLKGKRRGRRASLSLSDRSSLFLGSTGHTSSMTVSSRDLADLSAPHVTPTSKAFDRFTSCCEVTPNTENGSFQRPLKHISSLEPPKAPTRILSPMKISKDRKICREAVNTHGLTIFL